MGLTRSAYVITTNRCNMRCEYCYEREFFKDNYVDMSLETINKCSDFLAGNASANYFVDEKNHVAMFYFGGEPTLNWDVIKQNVLYNKEIEKTRGIRFGLYFLTNGREMPADPEYLDFLDSHMGRIQISLDGCKESHNSSRSHWDEIVNNLYKMKSKLRKPIMVRMTLTPDNLKYAYDSFRVMGDLSCELAITPELEGEWKKEHLDLIDDQFSKIMNYYKKMSSRRPLKFNITEAICNSNFTECHAGANLCGIDVHGNIYPCHRFIFHKPQEEWRMGNVDTGVERYPRFKNLVKNCQSCSCNVCHPCPSSLIGFDIKLPSIYCAINKKIQEVCEPIAKEVYQYNFNQTQLSFMKLILSQNITASEVAELRNKLEVEKKS